MGVLGLWQILEPVGHPIKIEGLEGKRLGVDANVWLYKFIRGFREKDNSANLDAHKLGLFNRISKLLFYKIKPVFVFDGPAPVLKRRTLERRQNVRNKHLSKVQDTAMKLLADQLKGQYPDADLDQVRIALPSLRSHNLVAAEKFTDEDRDLFYLPPKIVDESELDSDTDFEEEKSKPTVSPIKLENHQVYHIDTDDEDDEKDVKFTVPTDGQDVDIESEEFAKLPAEVRYEILVDIKEARRRIRRDRVLPEDANSFSSLQMERLRSRRLVQEKIEQCEKDICSMYTGEINGQSIQSYRMQSDSTSTMIYLTNSKDRKPSHDKKQESLNPNLRGIYNGETYNPKPNLSDDHETINITSTTIDLTESPAAPSVSMRRPSTKVDDYEIHDVQTDDDDDDGREENEKEENIKPASPIPDQSFDSENVQIDLSETDSTDEDEIENTRSTLPNTSQDADTENQQVHHLDTDDEEGEIDTVEHISPINGQEINIENCQVPIVETDDEDVEFIPAESSNANVEPKDFVQVADRISVNIEEAEEEIEQEPVSPRESPLHEEPKSLNLPDLSDERNDNTHTTKPDSPVPIDSTPAAVTSSQQPTSSQSLGERLQSLEKNLEASNRMANKVTNKIVEEAKELLRLFGIPYIDAAGEAEAQCALLEKLKLTEGTITDDSDVWLFGAQNVYRYFFSDDKYVMQYKMTDIEFHIRMNRETLVCFAMLVGSDYTDGIMNVGPVNALEILSEFPGENMEPLVKFKSWKEKYLASKDRVPGSRKREKLLKFRLPDEFPSRAVFEGYMRPMADTSTEEFSWGVPELDELREYARRHFGWDVRKADEKLLPVMKKVSEKTTQPTIDKFFFKTAANQNPELFRSKRVNEALNKIAKVSSQSSDVVDLSESDTDEITEKPVAKKTKKTGNRNKRRKIKSK